MTERSVAEPFRNQSTAASKGSILLALLLVLTTAFGSLAGQCEPVWRSGAGLPDTDNSVATSVSWDPDGAGPLPPHVVLAGDFITAGDQLCRRIVAYEPNQRSWSSLGDGMNARVLALAVLPNGDLVAAGDFTMAGGVAASRIARWDGVSWQPLGAGIDGRVHSLAVLPNGHLVAGGEFSQAGSVAAQSVARWDGVAWSPLGAGLSGSWPGVLVQTLLVLGNGDLIAGGAFETAGAVAAPNIARWDGAVWSPIGPGIGFYPGGRVTTLAQRPSGEIVASATSVTSVSGLVQWDGASWVDAGAGLTSRATLLATGASGELLAGGTDFVARFYGVSWSTVGTITGFVEAITPLTGGELLVGGRFQNGPSLPISHARRFDGAAWGPLSVGLDGMVTAVAAMPNGDVIVGGDFTGAGGLPGNYLARWRDGAWTAFGAGLGRGVRALAVMPNDDVIAGGWFLDAGGTLARRIARWDGASWSPLGPGVNSEVSALLVTRSGDLIATGAFTIAGAGPANRIAKWDGTSWSPLGAGLGGTFPLLSGAALCELPNGDIVVGGSFQTAGGVATNGVARWDGTSWSALGVAPDTVQALAVLPNGDLVAGGAFQQVGGVVMNSVARWDGTTWSPLGAGVSNSITALLALPGGDLIATGIFDTAGGGAARRIARWDGTAWSNFGDGISMPATGSGRALAQLPNGDVMVAGLFSGVGSLAARNLAVLSPPCAAAASSFGSGCQGQGGANELGVETLPWLGSTCTLRGTGMPSSGLVVGVRGLGTASVPLASILPQGTAGCLLQVTPDLLSVLVPAGGVATESFAVPNSPTLIQQTLHAQMVAIELDASFAITAVTSSNGVSLQIGVF